MSLSEKFSVMKNFKPEHYNSLSPYLIVDGAQKLVEMLIRVFNGTVLRKFERNNGLIAHVEIMLDDSILMISDSTAAFPSQKSMMHFYVSNVEEVFQLALSNGCTAIENPIKKEGDPDIRGAFYDPCGNYWAVSTQTS